MPPYPLIEFSLAIGVWEIVDAALPDTGYDGAMLIPAGVGREVASPASVTDLWLPDRSRHAVRGWSGRLLLGSARFDVEVVAFGSEYVIGREVLDQLEICFEFGQRVRLKFERSA